MSPNKLIRPNNMLISEYWLNQAIYWEELGREEDIRQPNAGTRWTPRGRLSPDELRRESAQRTLFYLEMALQYEAEGK